MTYSIAGNAETAEAKSRPTVVMILECIVLKILIVKKYLLLSVSDVDEVVFAVQLIQQRCMSRYLYLPERRLVN